MKKLIVVLICVLLFIFPVSAAEYSQYESAPSGVSFLAGDIMPWDDYIIFRSDENVSVSVYGQVDKDGVFETATVRTVYRPNNYGSYVTSETTESNVSVDITEPYYCYSNIYGVAYNLPASQNITALFVGYAFVTYSLIAVFRLVWSFRKGVAK